MTSRRDHEALGGGTAPWWTGAVNAQWHDEHVLGQGASMDRRVEWHLEHAEACGCRPVPATVAAELERRGVPVPQPRGR